MSRAVLDASAILAFLRGEPGAGIVAGYRGDSLVSAVNVAEAGGRLSDFGMRGADVRRSIDLMALEIVPFDAEQAHAAAGIRPSRAAADCRSATAPASSWRRGADCRR